MADITAKGSPVPQQENGEVSDSPQYVTIEQFNTALNGMASSQKKEFRKSIDELKGLLVSQQQEKVEKEQPEKVDPNANPEFAKMQKQLAETTKRLEAISAEKEAEIVKRKDTELNTSLQAELAKIGVPASRIKAVVAMMKHEDKVVGYDEDGSLVFKTPNGDTDLAAGIKGWSKTDEGKEFIAATGVKGAGNKSPNASKFGSNSTPTVSQDQFWSAIAAGRDPTEL